MREELVKLILERLDQDAEAIAADFAAEKGVKTRYCSIDNLLPENVAMKIKEAFPPTDKMRLGQFSRDKSRRNRWTNSTRVPI